MSTNDLIIVHKYNTTLFLILMPVFAAIGCFILIPVIVVPLTTPMNLQADFSNILLLACGALAAVGMPILGACLFLFIPSIITTLDPQRRVLVIERKWPLWKSAKEYRLSDIADVQTVYAGSHESRSLYRIALILKTGEEVSLELSATGNKSNRDQAAAKARALLEPYLHLGG